MNKFTSSPRVGIVIPTLGTRVEYLSQAVESIRQATTNGVYILVVGPSGVLIPKNIEVDDVVVDPGHGLAAAINRGIESLPQSVQYVNWLGDDDLLEPGAIDLAAAALDGSVAPFVFGGCRYIDAQGHLLFVNRSGRWAIHLMRFGPQLIPQPGAMFRRDVYMTSGGLNSHYKWAFDLDIFIRLSRMARPVFVPHALSSFRWHDDSLSVGGRRGSVNEASSIRRRNLHPAIRPFAFLWEPIVRQIILRVGQRIKTKEKS
jgi:glycosyltransferase involved in cell wall biosynthesis